MRPFFMNMIWLGLCFITSSSQVIANQHPFVVETDWLNSRLNSSDIIIIDVRNFDQYQQSHINNAINLPVDDTFGTGINNNLLAPLSVVGNILNQSGIQNAAHIILYDNGRLIDAARLFWVLEVFGHTEVSVLNGGLMAWNKDQYPMTQQLKKPLSSHFIPAINPAALATTFSVQLSSANNDHVLIDVRPEKEYQGQQSRTDQFGHIPGAINIPSSRLINPITEKLYPQHQLAELYKFLNKDKPITVYCNKGKQSALSYFVLRQLGFAVNAYNGAWFEWSKNPLLPKEMGKQRVIQ